MTITDRTTAERLANLEACAEYAPEGTYVDARAVAAFISDFGDRLPADVRALGLRADNSDHCRNAEIAIYAYILASNPSHTTLATAEAFGAHCADPELRRRLVATATRDRDQLRALGKLPLPSWAPTFPATDDIGDVR